MSQMMKKSLMLLLLGLSVAVIVSCSSPNSNSLVNPDTGKHSANWMTGSPIVHGATAETGLDGFSACKVCHGDNFRGRPGWATVSCYDCHNGPGLNHPAPGWVVPVSSSSTLPFHKTLAGTDLTLCAKCHDDGSGQFLGGAAGRACSFCHVDGPTAVHIWNSANDFLTSPPLHGAYVGPDGSNNGTAKCANENCHGDPSLTADVHNGLSGPHCNGSCHKWPNP